MAGTDRDTQITALTQFPVNGYFALFRLLGHYSLPVINRILLPHIFYDFKFIDAGISLSTNLSKTNTVTLRLLFCQAFLPNQLSVNPVNEFASAQCHGKIQYYFFLVFNLIVSKESTPIEDPAMRGRTWL